MIDIEQFDLEVLNKELARRKFSEFVRQAWPIAVDRGELMWNWHLDTVCDHLQAVFEGKMQNLIINIPPRLSKSLLCSVLYPAWVWLNDPGHWFLCTSKSDDVVVQNATIMRNLVRSAWYEGFYPQGFTLVKDTEHYFANNYGGYRRSHTSATAVKGLNANTLIIDDPLSTEDSRSRVEREKIQRALTFDFTSRLTPPGKGARILIMQRLHHEDTSGVYLKDDSWDRIILPAIWDGDHRSKTKLGFVDPRQEIGDLLFPEYLDQETLERFKVDFGPQAFSAEYQQRAVAPEGSIVKWEWLKHYTHLPHVKRWSWSWDCAFKVGDKNDYSVGTLWAECEDGYYLVDMVRKKLEYTALKHMIQSCYDQNPSSEIIIEDCASGQSLLQDFKRFSTAPVVGVRPNRDMPGKKEERLEIVAGLFESGKVFIPENASWKNIFAQEIVEFGFQPHDDVVDSTTQYLFRMIGRNKRTRITIV